MSIEGIDDRETQYCYHGYSGKKCHLMEKERQRKFWVKPVFRKREMKEKQSLVVKVALTFQKKLFYLHQKKPFKKR